MRRILWLLTAAIALSLIICSPLKFVEMSRAGRGSTQEAFERIQVGMTYAEVKQLLDCPPGRYGWPSWPVGAKNIHSVRWEHWMLWQSEESWIMVCFADDGRVVKKDGGPAKSMT